MSVDFVHTTMGVGANCTVHASLEICATSGSCAIFIFHYVPPVFYLSLRPLLLPGLYSARHAEILPRSRQIKREPAVVAIPLSSKY
jgi:hypothetical protein